MQTSASTTDMSPVVLPQPPLLELVAHELHEVLAGADRIIVLRLGREVGTVAREGATEQDSTRLMVGREVVLRVEKRPAQPGPPLLAGEASGVLDDRGLEAVRGVSFDVRDLTKARARKFLELGLATAGGRRAGDALEEPAPPIAAGAGA